MVKKTNPLIMRVPDPFDGTAKGRLTRMGILNKEGQLDKKVMPVFAGIFSGLFFDDLCDFYDDTKHLLAIFMAFQELQMKQDYQHMFLLLSLQYDYIRKPLPDPVWWLAGDNLAVREFMELFMELYGLYMAEACFLEPAKGG